MKLKIITKSKFNWGVGLFGIATIRFINRKKEETKIIDDVEKYEVIEG